MFDKPKHCDLLTFNFNFFQFFFPVFFKFFWGLASISNRTLSWGLNEEYIPSSTMSSNANYCEETKHKINACSSGNKQTNRKRWNKQLIITQHPAYHTIRKKTRLTFCHAFHKQYLKSVDLMQMSTHFIDQNGNDKTPPEFILFLIFYKSLSNFESMHVSIFFFSNMLSFPPFACTKFQHYQFLKGTSSTHMLKLMNYSP